MDTHGLFSAHGLISTIENIINFPALSQSEKDAITIAFIISAAITTVSQYFMNAFRRKVELTHLYVLFSERYNKPEMGHAVKALTDYYKKNPATFLTRWKEDSKGDDSWVIELKTARRTVDRYYFDIAQLYNRNYVDRRLARMLCSQWGLNVYYKICAPMDAIHSPPHEDDPYRILGRVRRKYGEGTIY